MGDEAALDQLLRFAVFNSAKKGYHRRGRQSSSSLPIRVVRMPFVNNAAQSQGDSRKCSVPRPSTLSQKRNVARSQEQRPQSQRSRYGFRRQAVQSSYHPTARPCYSGRSMGNPRMRPTLQRYDQPQQAYASSRLGHHFSPMSVQPSLQHVHFQPVRQVQQPTYGQPPLSYGQPLPSRPMNVSWNMPPNAAPLRGGHPAVVQARPQGAHGPTRPPLTRLTRARIYTNAKQPQSPLTVAGIAPSPLMHLPEIISVSPSSSRPPSSRQFAFADNSTTAHSTVSDDAAMSAHFSLSSASPSVPSEMTANRDIYDFRLKRNAANIHHMPKLVTRRLREMPLRNTLSLGLARADSSPSAEN